MSAGDRCKCGHPQHVHVGYTGGCGLCDSCAGLRIPADERPEFDPPHLWEEGL